MSEWWTYTLSDFLLFSPRTYYRLFELYNADIWPAQIVSLALGAAILATLRNDARWRGRAVAAILALCWFWIAAAFHIRHYATINWAAAYFAAGFAIQALLLAWTGLVRDRLLLQPLENPIGRVGLTIFLFALLIQPLIGPLLGRAWRQVELFGVAPDPSAVATLGILLLATNRVAWELLLIPIIWCAVSGTTLWAMESPDALLMPFVALVVLFLAGWRTRSRSRRRPSLDSGSTI